MAWVEAKFVTLQWPSILPDDLEEKLKAQKIKLI
jgi:hypothetical protein